MENLLPTLWHLPTSHYSEKVRWALDHKGVAARRRAPLPGAHVVVARRLTRGACDTLPVLQLDGRVVSGSTAIVVALENRFPRRPLYPIKLSERRRVGDLIDYFDETVAPAVRLLVFHELAKEPQKLAEFAAASAPWPLSRLGRAAVPYARGVLRLRYRVSARSVAEAGAAREAVTAGFDRVAQDLRPSGYLTGSEFGVADLTAAALLYPIVRPPEGPFGAELGRPAGLEELRAELRRHSAWGWVEDVYRHHRPTRSFA